MNDRRALTSWIDRAKIGENPVYLDASSSLPAKWSGPSLAEVIIQVFFMCVEETGLGYRDNTIMR